MTHHLTQATLAYHSQAPTGKVALAATKPLTSVEELSMAYTPGVGAVCEAIAQDPLRAYDLTAKSHLVGIITNGSAVLGLGNLGPLASKPVMEGKAVLMKQFAGVDAFDLELDAPTAEELIATIRAVAPTFGAINLEDIKAPTCFVVTQALQEALDIPVFHDDQQGTAIVVAAALENALSLAGKELATVRIVINGAGAGALATAHLLTTLGLPKEHLAIFDSRGHLHQERADLNMFKQPFAQESKIASLPHALVGADVFIGLSAANVLPGTALQGMTADPILLALANPTPEIDPALARRLRPDVILGTGRSDHPNQVNNVLAFPYLFRGALDVRARRITDGMCHAVVQRLAQCARQASTFGRDHLLPSIFEAGLLPTLATAVAQAACADGVAQRPITDWESYRAGLLVGTQA